MSCKHPSQQQLQQQQHPKSQFQEPKQLQLQLQQKQQHQKHRHHLEQSKKITFHHQQRSFYLQGAGPRYALRPQTHYNMIFSPHRLFFNQQQQRHCKPLGRRTRSPAPQIFYQVCFLLIFFFFMYI